MVTSRSTRLQCLDISKDIPARSTREEVTVECQASREVAFKEVSISLQPRTLTRECKARLADTSKGECSLTIICRGTCQA